MKNEKVEVLRFARTGVLFGLFLIAAYVSVVFLGSAVRYKDKSLIRYMLDELHPGGHGHSLERFSEIGGYRNVDILFMGSSHCYRSFDPRMFKAAGYSSFNLGSSAQTPMNSYYLFKRYIDQLNPKQLIYECYFPMFGNDGFESFRDLSVNIAPSHEIIEMGLMTLNPMVPAWLFSSYFADRRELKQREMQGDRYVAGGYVENSEIFDQEVKFKTESLKMEDRQFDYLERILSDAKRRGIKATLIVQPLRSEQLASCVNYNDFAARLLTIAGRHGADFKDFNGMGMMGVNDYKDLDHLNRSGVEKFNKALIQYLKAEAA